jgi:hypothetical protein
MKKVARNLWYVSAICFLALGAQALYAAGTEASLELLSPGRGEDLPYGTAPVIAVSIFDAEGDTDTSTVELKVDGLDFTGQSNISAFLVTYTMEGAAPGRHTVSFLVEDREGNKASLDSFFTVSAEPAKERKVTANGSVKTGVEYDKNAAQSVVGVLETNVFGRLSDTIDYSAIVDITNKEQSDGQRVSNYRLDLSTPYGAAVFGDATPAFSTYSINGADVFGVHLLPQFGFFGMELLFGQNLRAVDDPLTGTETFRQSVYGGKIKLGDPRTFQWGLSFLKVEDDMDSIEYLTDTLSPTPKDNIVLGMDLSFSLFKERVSFSAEANESWLTEDTTGGPADVPDAPSRIDPSNLEWLFTFNETTHPFVPGLANLAAKAALQVGPIADNTLSVEYSYVGAGFSSLANPTVLTDRAGVRAWDTLWLLQRKLFFNLGFQYYTDNLQDTETNTTKNVGYSGAAYAYPTDYLTMNAGVDVQTVDNKGSTDTVNTTVNGGGTYVVEVLSTRTSLYGTITAALFNDNFAPGNDSNKYSPRLGAVSFFTNIPLDTKAAAGVDVGDVDTSVYLEGSVGYRFLKDETLYAFTNLVYETGIEQLDWKVGADYEAPRDITFEADFEYITVPGSSDVILSAYATKRF